MNVGELIKRLEEFDPKMEVKIQKHFLDPTETIATVEPAEYPCPRPCILIKGD